MEKRTAHALAKGDLSSDFFIRNRGDSMQQMIVLTVVTVLIATATISINEKLATTSIVLILFGCISWYLTLDVKNNLNLVKATEFQNALFSSALGMNHDFTFIVNLKDSKIFYHDRLLQNSFPYFFKQEQNDLFTFLEQAKVNPDNQKALQSLLETGSAQNMVLEIEIEEKREKIALSLEPVPRPTGFMLIRGRKL